MRNNIIVNLILLVSLVTVNRSQEENTIFEEYFNYTQTVKFRDDILIGAISFLDVSNDGRLLITDQISNKVILLNGTGESKLNELSVDDCYPGFNWRPIYAKFSVNEILLLNSIPWGFRFSHTGECQKIMDKEFIAPLHINFLNDGKIVGFYNEHEPYLALMNKEGVTIKKFGEYNKDFINFLYRYEGGGVICDKDDNIYQISPYNWEISKYSSNGKFIGKIGTKPTLFRQIEKDLSSSPAEVLKEFDSIINGKTLVHSIHLLSTLRILVQYTIINYSGTKFFLQVLNLEGEQIIPKLIEIQEPVLCAKNSKIYLSHQPEMLNGNLPNPEIKVYDYIEKFEN